ncbi:interferon-induced very large GTPase 1-like [Nycticebus coucang]|uniref:interferon-induced very large GTPase 1-like n=1 Tax=Nycticebus coucang TaxID=9470 RepID=UPI00234C17B8|nr:interferon-induced very large GTPase 1-like [Nycticebus coucang]XP_053416633.1 interferon-induced very large GTPase 1-like [Nycticebus coucang]
MATAEDTPDKPVLRDKRRQDLQEMLEKVGLSVDFWLSTLQNDLGVTCAQALQYLEEKDLQTLKTQARHSWEIRALEKLLNLSSSLSELQKSQTEMANQNQEQAEKALKDIKDLMSQGKQQEAEAVKKKEAEVRESTNIPEKCGPSSKKPLKEVIDNMQKQLQLTDVKLSQHQNLADKDLVRWASGGLALQGIYKTTHQRDLIEKREKLLRVPKDFSLCGPQQGTRMETVEFRSSQEEFMFTQTIEKLGFSAIAAAKGGGWGFILEAGLDHSKHSESMKTQQTHCEQSYFCSAKLSYIPLASFYFSKDQLQLSEAALQELKYIEDLLDLPEGPVRCSSLRHKTKAFFHRFGSHANQGPVHLGGIYWWKAISEGFQREQLEEVKEQTAKALDIFIRGGSNRFHGVKVSAGMNLSNSDSKTTSQKNTSQNLQAKVQLCVTQTGGPPEASGLDQWKAGLIASNQTWHIIDQEIQLEPIWEILLFSHRSDFKNPIQVANYLKACYTDLTSPAAHIQKEEKLQNAWENARAFLQDEKSWEIPDLEEQLQKLMDFKQILSHQTESYDSWINMCLTDWELQNFLVNTVNVCKMTSNYKTEFIKSQLCSLLDPHIYRVANFPQAHSIMQWIFQSESEQEHLNISQYSELIEALRKIHNDLMEAKVKSESQEILKSQRKATNEVNMALSCFLKCLQETKQPDIQLLVLSIATGVGYDEENKTFQYLLGSDNVNFLINEMQTAQTKYQELRNICSYRAQAFVVFTGLTATAGETAISPKEKTQRMALIRRQLGKSITKEVAHVLTKLGADHNWGNLEKDLKLLINGDFESTISFLQIDEVQKQLQSLFHGKKKPHKTHENKNIKWKVIENGVFLELLQRLGLEHYYPKKMSRANFHLIYKTSVYNTQPSSEQELPFYFLQKLLMLDYKLRYLVFKDDKNTEQVYSSASNPGNERFDPYEDFLEDCDSPIKPSATTPRPHIHPMDIQMAIFHCADDFARQYILDKLSFCQFALPLVVPNPCTSQIEFSLWSLRQIRRSWQQGKENSYKNQQMCRVSTPIVSFIRVGNGLLASKSQIMNCLLSKHKHDVFFHRHCRGSSKDCLLMRGVVEICWFCPGGDEEDRFDNCVTFTNLHGDAKEHEQQLTFLKEVSSLIVVLMSTSDHNEENRKIVYDLCQSSRLLICLLDDKEQTMANNSSQKVKIGIRNRNAAELTEELTTTIRRLLELSGRALSLEDCSQIAHRQGFLIDEDQRDCKEAKEKAQLLVSHLGEMNLSQMKEKLLPLQGQLWHLWCKKDKELYHLREKGNQSIEQHRSEIETDKQIIRYQQLSRAFPFNDLMQSFLQILCEHSETHTKLYFLQWLSVFLDNLTAEQLENLPEKQRSLWLLVQTEKKAAPRRNSLQYWQNEIEAISTEISDCTLGIGHLLREVGQIYEALEEAFSAKDTNFLSIPLIAANLMISGIPIELMDGDASYVPLKWIAAVFDKVSEELGDKRVFVLSILGLQSSGKSTLLNALFGLQFTVGVGRCTKGAYMQLLKVENTFTEELGFDFMLVVDTEGLRSLEFSNKTQNWDNELATFVIGLANLTLINIFGENPAEMQDTLQIVVQAFLRMKQVKIFPSCLFVHQNVEEVTARDQIMEGRRWLEHRLDESAAIAAEQEQCPDVTCFSDVIKFDVNSHVYYFAHLWDGNPPMASPNPHYSHNVQELKSRILQIAEQESRRNIMKISDVKFRVQDLWRALVNENFIFSFRNTQEVMAMSKLETMYNHWTWELRSFMLGLQNQLINQIQNGKIQTLNTSTLDAPVTEKYEAIKQELEKYFNENTNREILVQWKANFENKLRKLKEDLISDSKRKANELISFKKGQEWLDKEKTGYENQLLEKSQKWALTVKGTEFSEEELHEKFNQLWKKWVYDVSSNLPQITEPDIDVDSEHILLEHFQKKLNMEGILKTNSGKKFQINYDEHVKMNKNYGTLEVCDKEFIKMITDNILSRFDTTLNNICKQQCDYDPVYFHEILRIIEKEVKSAPMEETYTFTNKYLFDLSWCLFQKASENFKEMHWVFKRANDPVYYLESKKADFFMSFKISCQGATSIKTFVDFLWQKLTPAISATVQKNLTIKIAGDMQTTCSAFSGNKANLEKHILISLAEEENFDNYWQYIHNPESFFRSYIENQIKRYCSDKGSEKIQTFLKISLENIKNLILSSIRLSTTIAKDKNSTVSEWLDLFCDYLGSNLIFPRKDLKSIEHQKIKDIEFLKEAMSTALDPAMKGVEQNCASMPMETIVPKIEKTLYEQLCGCWKQCPFCRAICTNTIPEHDGDHIVPFHRPQAVNGWYKDETGHFVIDCCTSSVASDNAIILKNGQKRPYKDYRQAGGDYATWRITPDSSTHPYWKWFVSHFRSKLEEKYQKKFEGTGKIPDAWANIRKQNMLNVLKNQ